MKTNKTDKNKQGTEWELKNNTIGMCKECSHERQKKWQKENKKLKDGGINVGDCVKLPITDENGTEHLWFEVMDVNKVCPTCKSDNVYESNLNKYFFHRCNGCGDYFAEFVGRCDNIPVVIEKIKHEDFYRFKFEDIEELFVKEKK